MSKSSFRWAFLIFSILNIWILTDSDKCEEEKENLKNDFYCDKFLISTFESEIDECKRVYKYIKYKMEDIDIELKESCPNFNGFLQKQSLKCSEKRLFSSCRDAMTRGSGVYQVKSRDNKISFVYCLEDPNGGDPWTVIQRRNKVSGNFNRTFDEYVKGFGDLLDSFWMGLEKIHELTTKEPFELWIEMTNVTNETKAYAKYDIFAISGIERNYSISALGNYNGTAGDALRSHDGYGFSVYDNIVDGSRPCANKTSSGWWFTDLNCGECNLNGDFHNTASNYDFVGVIWGNFTGRQVSLSSCHMAVREKYSQYC